MPEKLKVEEAVVKTDDIRADLTKKEEEAEAGLMESPDHPAAAVDAEEDEDEVGKPKEEADTEAAPAQPVNEWEQLDMVCPLATKLQNFFFSFSHVIKTNISEVSE